MEQRRHQGPAVGSDRAVDRGRQRVQRVVVPARSDGDDAPGRLDAADQRRVDAFGLRQQFGDGLQPPDLGEVQRQVDHQLSAELVAAMLIPIVRQHPQCAPGQGHGSARLPVVGD